MLPIFATSGNWKKGEIMAWQLLIGSDIGLLSLFTIAFIIVMAFYLIGFVKKHAEEDARNASK